MSATPEATGDAADRRAGVVLVTGLSGAGKTQALKALEDLGYEAVDNLPLSLLPRLVETEQASEHPRPLAVGVDVRTRDFGVDTLFHELDALMADPRLEARLVFIDCDDDVLLRRFTETRRRHPLAQDRPVTDGIRIERTLMARLRDRADPVIDTSETTPAELRRILQQTIGPERGQALSVFVLSFAYGLGLPRQADLVIDVRFLRNPHYDPDLQPLTGTDPRVGAHIEADPAFDPFFRQLTDLLLTLLPRYEAEGKSYLTVAVGCTGGRHRSVHVARRLSDWLAEQGIQVTLRHRDAGQDPGRRAGG